VRALAVNEDAIVVVSGIWQTTCTAVRAGDEGFLIDSPVLPDELDALPALLEQAGFLKMNPPALLCTHGDWDHVLGRLAFPEATLGAGEPTCQRLAGEPGAAQRKLRDFDDEHYISGRRPLGLGGVQSLPVPGRVALGDAGELELHRAEGHTADGTAFAIPWLELLVCGDYLSPVEIPMISAGGSAAAYKETLERFEPLLGEVSTVIPGHGAPLSREQAQRILAEDHAYITTLLDGSEPPLPDGRRSGEQRRIHAENLARI
jgi:glyoxylase-like metal-dependent hydrolase (beta-lactamase superfamily II)